MKSRTTRRFRAACADLPAAVRSAARKAFRQFQKDIRHPGLQFKRVHSSVPVYSARIGLDYRAVGVLRDDGHIVWFWIGGHAEYDRLLREL